MIPDYDNTSNVSVFRAAPHFFAGTGPAGCFSATYSPEYIRFLVGRTEGGFFAGIIMPVMCRKMCWKMCRKKVRREAFRI